MLKRSFILALVSLNLLCSKSQVKPVENLSMQNLHGYPLIDNIHSIKKILKQKCLDTINFKKGEIIADIGAGNGYLEGMLSLFNDSLTFYIQDIDTSICNQKSINKVVDFYRMMKKKPFTNKFLAVNGSDIQTNLPDGTFDKIFMIFTYPYLKDPVVFTKDVKQKLKYDGRLYLINPNVPVNDLTKSLKAEYGWNESSIDQEINDVTGCGFVLISKSKYSYTNEQGNPYIMVFKLKKD
jgi:ubiquinone/menaquinone biosynthesis C-methylase UbiE